MLVEFFVFIGSLQVTTNEHHLHIAAADSAPGFELLVKDIAEEFGAIGYIPTPVIMDGYNNDWDSLYPFSAVSPLYISCFVFSLANWDN